MIWYILGRHYLYICHLQIYLTNIYVSRFLCLAFFFRRLPLVSVCCCFTHRENVCMYMIFVCFYHIYCRVEVRFRIFLVRRAQVRKDQKMHTLLDTYEVVSRHKRMLLVANTLHTHTFSSRARETLERRLLLTVPFMILFQICLFFERVRKISSTRDVDVYGGLDPS